MGNEKPQATVKKRRYNKSEAVQPLIDTTISLLSDLGIPMEKSGERQQQRTAMAFLALAGVTKDWSSFREQQVPTPLSSRNVLHFWNDHFEEKLKDSSYDDVRSENLDELALGGLAVNDGDLAGGAKNDSRRKFTLSNDVISMLQDFGTDRWAARLKEFQANHHLLREELARRRNLHKISITLPGTVTSYVTSDDKHNLLQKAIIEQFVPAFTKDPQLLYFGDASKRTLHREEDELAKLGFFELLHEELPDVVVFDRFNGWIYLIEAYHSTGEWDEKRVLKIKRKLPGLLPSLIFITAFLDRAAFRAKAADIAWETEVWIAEDPEHMIHFNGDKFLGPYEAA